MKKFFGKAKKINSYLLGVATRDEIPLVDRQSYIFVGENLVKIGYAANILSSTSHSFLAPPSILLEKKDGIDQISDGDVLKLNHDGSVELIWKKGGNGNCIFVTSRCTCNCLMCPQPPMPDQSDFYDINLRLLNLLDKNSCETICITGGEPTLPKKQFLNYIAFIKNNFTNKRVDILSNGQTLSDLKFASDVARFCPQNTTFCISIHADTAGVHDKIVKAPGGFKKTVYGIQNLARLGLLIELRFVINKINIERIKSFSEYVVKNFPFVSHVAFMALEMTGLAKNNFDLIWIDPLDCKEALAGAVKILSRAGIPVSIYNTPLCMVDDSVRMFARKSISDWKNIYLDVCSECIDREQCCGFFSTSCFISDQIKPRHQNKEVV